MQFVNVGLDDIREQIDALEAQRAVTEAQEVNQGRSDLAFFTYSGVYDIWYVSLLVSGLHSAMTLLTRFCLTIL